MKLDRIAERLDALFLRLDPAGIMMKIGQLTYIVDYRDTTGEWMAAVAAPDGRVCAMIGPSRYVAQQAMGLLTQKGEDVFAWAERGLAEQIRLAKADRRRLWSVR